MKFTSYILVMTAAFMLLLTPAMSMAAKPVSANIRWTEYGIPHVTAESFQGVGFGYGYAVSRDRLCVLVDRALTLRGERSRWYGAEEAAIVGFASTKNIDSDLFYRIQLSDSVTKNAELKLSRDALRLAAGYADGINAYIKMITPAVAKTKCGVTTMPHFKRSDVIRSMLAIGAIWKGMRVAQYATASNWDLASGPKQIEEKLVNDIAGRRVPRGIGSNAWAYGGDTTSTGSAILMANPHTSWNGNDWLLMHQMHLTIPGVMDVAGADFVGFPMPVTGFNGNVAWTIEAPFTVKYYVLQKMAVSAENATYLIDRKTSALKFKRMAIAVRTPEGRIKFRKFRIPISSLGPLFQLPETEGQPRGWYAITDAGDGNANALDQLTAMAQARDAKEFVNAVESNRGIGAHMIAADRNGMAIYTEAGPLIAVSDDELANCRLGKDYAPDILDGQKRACNLRDKDGHPKLAKRDELPSYTGRGIIQNLNNSYHKSVYGEPSKAYSALLGEADDHDLRWDMSEKRLAEVLKVGEISPEIAVTLALDNRNFAAEEWLDRILEACPFATEKSVLEGCAALKKWDRRNNADSRGAVLFSEAWARLQELETYPEITSDAAQLSAGAAAGIQDALKEATAYLDALEIPYDQKWGNLMARNTAKGRVMLHGGSGTEGVLNVLEGTDLNRDGYSAISNGTSYLQLVYWNQGNMQAKTLLAQGQSSDINSPHYADQLDQYARRQLVPFPFTSSEVEAATIEEVTVKQ